MLDLTNDDCIPWLGLERIGENLEHTTTFWGDIGWFGLLVDLWLSAPAAFLDILAAPFFSVTHSAAWEWSSGHNSHDFMEDVWICGWSVFIPYEVRIGAAPTYALNYKASCFADSPNRVKAPVLLLHRFMRFLESFTNRTHRHFFWILHAGACVSFKDVCLAVALASMFDFKRKNVSKHHMSARQNLRPLGTVIPGHWYWIWSWNSQEWWGTHKKRWPFQPRPSADVIGLVRRSYIMYIRWSKKTTQRKSVFPVSKS